MRYRLVLVIILRREYDTASQCALHFLKHVSALLYHAVLCCAVYLCALNLSGIIYAPPSGRVKAHVATLRLSYISRTWCTDEHQVDRPSIAFYRYSA